ARRVHMTAMPQMVALFNGVGGGAVAIIAWVEYRHHFGGNYTLKTEIPSLFAAIVGSISFWGSNIAFGKLQAIIPSRPIKLPGQAIINAALFVIAVASAIILAAGTHSQALFILGILVAAALLGNMVVLPIGGADMPVVISLLNAFTGLSAVLDLEKGLVDRGGRVLFAIRPVARGMAGDMKVLLAESQVPYEALKEMDEVNPGFQRTDVTLVIGANDVTNPAAKNEPGSP